MAGKHFEDLDIWKSSAQVAIEIYQLSNQGSFSKDYGLRDQMRRSSVSISSNIAEGHERQSNKEFVRFLYIAKGSCGELRSQLHIAYRLNYIDEETYVAKREQIIILIKGIYKLISYLSETTK